MLPWYLTFPLAILGAAAVGALWALIPAYLQAKRGSHIVITTIMFNFIAASAMVYLLVDVLKPAGVDGAADPPACRGRATAEADLAARSAWVFAALGSAQHLLPAGAGHGVCWSGSLIWRTKLGYEIRTMGFSPKAARYAGISETRIIIITMMISGALAGMMALNPIMGDQHNVSLDFVSGAGFVGIAVALMGRSHPAGIVPAAILFGMLYQGGAELAFEMPAISRDMIVIIQGLVILFAGALEHMFRPTVQTLLATISPRSAGVVAAKGKGA